MGSGERRLVAGGAGRQLSRVAGSQLRRSRRASRMTVQRPKSVPRSEEHTSELQSLMRTSYAVFRLKKKSIQSQPITNNNTQHYPLHSIIHSPSSVYLNKHQTN